MEYKALDLEIRAGDGDGVIEGYGSVFGGKADSYGDVIDPGAFRKSIAKRMPKMLWQHRMDEPIGAWQEVTEDDKGLRMRGRLALKVQRGVEAYELVKAGAIDGLSIGFRTAGYRMDGETRVLTEVDLYEVSMVTVPANARAKITAVKTVRDLEGALSDWGFSRKAAKAIAGYGKGWIGHRDDDAGDPDETLRDAAAIKAELQRILRG